MRLMWLGIAIGCAAAADAHAERRAFTNTYEYLTMDKNAVEVDALTTQGYGFGSNKAREFELQVAAVYGITSRWDVAAFQVYDEIANDDPMVAGTPFHYAESRFRTRYRFAEKGELPVDLLGYLEAGKPFTADGWRVAPRIVVSRSFDDLTVVANGFADFGIATPVTQIDVGWAAGATYQIVPELDVGVEGFGVKQLKGGSENDVWLGPSISWAPSPRAWVAGGAAFGLTSASIDFRQQVIIGLVL